MSLWRLILRNVWFHRRAGLAVLLGVAAAAAVLGGALIVGDSVRRTMENHALQRVAGATHALGPGGTFFRQELEGTQAGGTALIVVPGVARNGAGTARANQVQVLGIGKTFLGRQATEGNFSEVPAGKALLNTAAARQLRVNTGDEIILRVQKPGLLPGDAALAPRDEQGLGWRVEIAGMVPAEMGGNLDLAGAASQPLNIFVNLTELAERIERPGKANLLLVEAHGEDARPGEAPLPGRASLPSLVGRWTLEDVGLEWAPAPGGQLELRSLSVFIGDPVRQAAEMAHSKAVPLLTYLANLIVRGSNATPYSLITAAGPPYIPADMRENEILLNEWLAADLGAQAGDVVQVVYFQPESGANLVEATNAFRVRGVVPLGGVHADKTLMPKFPGIEEADSNHDWKGGFPLVHKIRDKDEAYWEQHRGTPKAFITPAAGEKLWGNRFGSITSIRFSVTEENSAQTASHLENRILAQLSPETAGLTFIPVRQMALRTAAQGQDFGQLFLGFSGFLISAALLLTWLLFRLAVETRARESGALMAMGFSERRVRWMYLAEALCLAIVGASLGTLAGMLYARALLRGLGTIWKAAVPGAVFELHVSPTSLFLAFLAAIGMSLAAVWFAVKGQGKRSARELLTGPGADAGVVVARTTFGLWLGALCLLCALGTAAWGLLAAPASPASLFFLAGTLALVGLLALARHFIGRTAAREDWPFTTWRMVLSFLARRPTRSLASMAVVACGAFMIIAVSAFRMDARMDSTRRDSGTGGFSLLANASLPVFQDLNTASGREALGLDIPAVPSNENSGPGEGLQVVAFRVRKGEEASCLNPGRAQTPRLLGVNSSALNGRFKFVEVHDPGKGSNEQWRDAWGLLKSKAAPGEIPAIGDANSIRWSMGKAVGETIDYTDERGKTFKVRIVGAVANSVLQGSLVIEEEAFTRRFPGEAGYKFFLIDTAGAEAGRISEILSKQMEDYGLECVSTVDRLNEFNAVQNTYLGTFQLLGALGLLLGSVGLAVVLVRNVIERRGELAVLMAAGFRKRRLKRLMLAEHVLLLAAGLIVGGVAAAIAVLPAVASRQPIGWVSLLLAILAVIINGAIWTWLAAVTAMRANLVETLKTET
jgi:putative ABC transport system permease protein